MKSENRIQCSICGNAKLEKIADQLRNSEGEVFYCRKCDLGILGKPEKNVKEYYSKEYRRKFSESLEKPSSNPQDIFNFRKGFQEDRLNIIKEYFDETKIFLEIGSSAGQFLVHVTDQFAECVGIELDTRSAEFTEKKLKTKVHTEELERCGLREQSFDYIAAFQVLEHIVDPKSFLREVIKYLKDEGKIFIEVPNLYDPLLKLWSIESYQRFYYHEAHTHYFSKTSLEILCQLCNIEIEKIYFIQDYNFLNHFFWYFNNKPQKDCVFGLSKVHIDFLPGDIGLNDKLNSLFRECDSKYKQLLGEHEMTSNIFLVLRKTRT